ncbi:hypothetical protein M3193_06445 [Sporosarcina luteola]|uniref:hypothetical protein n=1 Tax=Sporosarcina luteola TaxID=582850 RepID=UPI002041E34C|nr:hypothetical protein [Sporosarcina luteola]MCM3743777.1 hypothetical protein [Sporosarcina luteola]
MILKLFLAINILTAIQPFINQHSPITSSNPDLKRIYTDYPKDGNWVQIPKGTKNITFYVEAENTETVLFWLIPTGTQTWTERKLIGYDIRENPTDNIFSLTWTIDKSYLHDHLHVQALGDEILEQDTINLSME